MTETTKATIMSQLVTDFELRMVDLEAPDGFMSILSLDNFHLYSQYPAYVDEFFEEQIIPYLTGMTEREEGTEGTFAALLGEIVDEYKNYEVPIPKRLDMVLLVTTSERVEAWHVEFFKHADAALAVWNWCHDIWDYKESKMRDKLRNRSSYSWRIKV
jgi:hypothetical protein